MQNTTFIHIAMLCKNAEGFVNFHSGRDCVRCQIKMDPGRVEYILLLVSYFVSISRTFSVAGILVAVLSHETFVVPLTILHIFIRS